MQKTLIEKQRMSQFDKKVFLSHFLKHAAFDGWTYAAMESADKDLGLPENSHKIHFSNGINDLVELYVDHINEKMASAIDQQTLQTLKIRERIEHLVWTRLSLMEADKEAAKKLIAYFCLPFKQADALRYCFKTCDEMWYLAGDTSTDFNYYSKRMLLGMVYISILVYWLGDDSDSYEGTREFLKRRIENVMAIPKVKFQIKELLNQFKAAPKGS